MGDLSQMGPHGGRSPSERTAIYAQVSSLQPAPSSFTDPLFVVIPYDPNNAIRFDNWPVIHGATLPALNADVLIITDDQHNKRVIWWQGTHT